MACPRLKTCGHGQRQIRQLHSDRRPHMSGLACKGLEGTGLHQINDIVQLQEVVHTLPRGDEADQLPAHAGGTVSNSIHYQAVQNGIAA